MHGEGFFFQAFVYLLAAVVSVPVAKRLGLGSVLGYLIAGFIIGHSVLGLIGEEGQDILHFAEFGVVMMLFLIGLELQPSRLWHLRGSLIGLGGLQVCTTTAVIAALGMLLGLPLRSSLAVGMTLSLSSTAIVLQTLTEKGLIKTAAGQSSFSVLLFQDIAVIPILAVMPLLAVKGVGVSVSPGSPTWIEGLPAWGQVLLVTGVIAAIILTGLFLLRPIFRMVARTGLREIFTAASLLLIIGTALLMAKIGLSPALGTFLAGVVLANSEYRHELEGDIEPFKGLLLGLFFISVGASIDVHLLASNPGLIGMTVAGLIVVKLIILFVLGRIFHMGLDQNLLFSFALAQGGEFAFVLFSFAVRHHVISDKLANPLISAVALSMVLTPLLLLINEKLIQPSFGTKERETREPDRIDEENSVIIAGFGNFGSIIGRILWANGVGITVLDVDSDKVEHLRKLGLKVFYGDASRHDLLLAAGAEKAKMIILGLDQHEKILDLVKTVQTHFPHLAIYARAMGRKEAYELLDAGVLHVYRQTLDTSLRVGVDVLRAVGFRSYQAHRAAMTFREHDEETVRALRDLRHDQKTYYRQARQRIRDIDELLLSELRDWEEHPDAGWDTASMVEEFGSGKKKE